MSRSKALLSIINKGKKAKAIPAPFTKIFFRKTKGQVNVFSKHTKVDTESGVLNVFFQNKGRTVADMKVDIRDADFATTIDTKVEPEFRRKGLSRQLFKDSAKKLTELGKKYFRSGELRSSAQAKIRGKYNTKFIEQYTGRYGENTRFNIRRKDAIMAIDNGGVVQATTKLPLEKTNYYAKDKYIYRKIRGRIVRIKVTR
jgi:predicted GNAT family acetyltransferase